MSDAAKLPKGDYLATRTISHVSASAVATNAFGNPTYRVFFTDEPSALTSPGSAIGYGVTNSDCHGVPLEIQFTRSGRIRYATVISTGKEV